MRALVQLIKALRTPVDIHSMTSCTPAEAPQSGRESLARLILQWNWKTAVLCAIVRTGIFLAPGLWGRHPVLGRTVVAEYLYALIVSGFYGTVTQTYCRAEPRQVFTALLLVGIPVSNHVLELVMHRAFDIPTGFVSMTLTYAFTMASTLFSIYVMRLGYLTTGRA